MMSRTQFRVHKQLSDLKTDPSDDRRTSVQEVMDDEE